MLTQDTSSESLSNRPTVILKVAEPPQLGLESGRRGHGQMVSPGCRVLCVLFRSAPLSQRRQECGLSCEFWPHGWLQGLAL